MLRIFGDREIDSFRLPWFLLLPRRRSLLSHLGFWLPDLSQGLDVFFRFYVLFFLGHLSTSFALCNHPDGSSFSYEGVDVHRGELSAFKFSSEVLLAYFSYSVAAT